MKRFLLVAIMALLFAPSLHAIECQGLVTGRIYPDLAANPSAMDDIQSLGAKWIRIEFEEFMDARTASYDSPHVKQQMAMYRKIIALAHARGIKVLGIVNYHSFPDTPDFPLTDKSLQAYVDSVKWHLRSYPIDAVEIWNEPGNQGGNPFASEGGTGRLGRYSRMMIMTYEQVKPRYPKVLFVGPATANAERGDWTGMPNNGKYTAEDTVFNCTPMLEYRASHDGELPLDVISWHAYGTDGKPDLPEFYFGGTDFFEYYDEIKAYTDRTGRNVIGDYPIWFTEWGWDTAKVGEDKQREYYGIMLGMFAKRPQIKIPFWYVYRDDEPPGEGQRGLRKNSHADFTKKRIYNAYKIEAHQTDAER